MSSAGVAVLQNRLVSNKLVRAGRKAGPGDRALISLMKAGILFSRLPKFGFAGRLRAWISVVAHWTKRILHRSVSSVRPYSSSPAFWGATGRLYGQAWKPLSRSPRCGITKGVEPLISSRHPSAPLATMAPPHLHPRSRMTSSLFAGTIAASFFVVALPHILPCPAPRIALADGELPEDGNGKRRRRRRPQVTEIRDGIAQFNNISEDELAQARAKTKRECPVPKPGGVLGELMGFHKSKNDENNENDR